MKIIRGSLTGERGDIIRDVFRGAILDINGKTYKLSKDVEELRLITKEESRSAFKMFLILLLGITIIGLVIAIPMLITHRKVQATVAIRLKDGTAFVAVADRSEWEALSKYRSIKLPEGFEVT